MGQHEKPGDPMTILTKKFWAAATERAIRGGAIAASAVYPVTAILDVQVVPNTAATLGLTFAWGAVGSLLLSLAGSQVGEKGEPSFTGHETLPPA